MKANSSGLCPCREFVKEIKNTPFTIFHPVADLGYFGWSPKTIEHKKLVDVTAEDILDRVEPSMVPDKVVSARQLDRMCPLKFEPSSSTQKHINRFPYDDGYVTALHVALKRLNDAWSDIKCQFMFSGSTLNMLAAKSSKAPSEYFAQVVPGTSIILLVKHLEYEVDHSAEGFQFEQLATGGSVSDVHSKDIVEHLQIMDVGGHRVLFAAECDGMDEAGNPVEVKASNPRHWENKTMFQMMSSGSLNVHAGQRRQNALQGVKSFSLGQVTRKATNGKNVAALQANILNGIQTLKTAFEAGSFDNGKVWNFIVNWRGEFELTAVEDRYLLLPPLEVVEKLLESNQL